MMGRQLIGILSIGTTRPSCVVIERVGNGQQLTPQSYVTDSLYKDDDPTELWTQLLRDAEQKANVTIDQLYIDLPLCHDSGESWFVTFEAEIACHGASDEQVCRKAVMEEMSLLLKQRGYRQCHASVGTRRLENGVGCYPVCALAVTEELYQKLEQLTEHMGVRLAGVRSATYDAAQYFASEQQKKDGVAYIHMGEGEVLYVAFKNNVLCRIGFDKKGFDQLVRCVRKALLLSVYQSWQFLKSFGLRGNDALGDRLRGIVQDMVVWLADELKPLEVGIGGAFDWIVAQDKVRAKGMIGLMQRQWNRAMRTVTQEPLFADRMVELLAMAYSVMGGVMPPLSKNKPLPIAPIANENPKVPTDERVFQSPFANSDRTTAMGFS